MLKIINNADIELTIGEKSIKNVIEKLYKEVEREVYLYVQTIISDKRPDFIIIDSSKGINILEIKDWELSYIKEMDTRCAILLDREDNNPIEQVLEYKDYIKGIFARKKLRLDRKIISSNVILTNIKEEESKESGIYKYLIEDEVNCIYKDKIKGLTIDTLFNNKDIEVNMEDMVMIRTSLFPEIKIEKGEGEVFALDKEQESFTKRKLYGPYIVTGLPGSGKTVMLIARAIHLIKENPNWNIIILTYNKQLNEKIKKMIDKVAKDVEGDDYYTLNIRNIKIRTILAEAKRVSGDTRNNLNNKDWEEVVETADEVLKNVEEEDKYDAVLIDEYQDFNDTWIKFSINLGRKYEYKKVNGEMAESLNLFMTGDRLQTIYDRKIHSWKEIGIDMRGRSELLKKPYRTGGDILKFAIEFLATNEKLKKEALAFYKEEDDTKIVIDNVENGNSLKFVEGDYREIIDEIESLLEEYNYEDILILCQYIPGKRKAEQVFEEIKKQAPGNIRTNMQWKGESDSGKIMGTTFKGAKGLEAKVAILVNVDAFSDVKEKGSVVNNMRIIYVGLTRGSEKVIIHASNFKMDTYAKKLLDLRKENQS